MTASANDLQASISLAIEANDLPSVNAGIEKLLAAIDRIPGSVSEGNAKFKDLLVQLQTLKDVLKNGFIDEKTGEKIPATFNNIFKELKGVETSLKNIKSLGKITEFFTNKDIENINKASSALQAAAKASAELHKTQQIKSGTFGLDATSIKEVTSATKTLQDRFSGIQQILASMPKPDRIAGRFAPDPFKDQRKPLLNESFAIGKNLFALGDLSEKIKADKQASDYSKALLEQEKIQRGQFVASVQRLEKASHDDRLKEEDRFQRERLSKLKDAEANETKETLTQQRLLESIRKRSSDGRLLAADATTAMANTPTGRTAFTAKGAYADQGNLNWANPLYAGAKTSQQELTTALTISGLKAADLRLSSAALTITQQIREVEKDKTAILIKNGKLSEEDNARFDKKLSNLRAQLSIQKSTEQQSNSELQKAAQENRANSMMARVQGQGGAALLAVQASLIANYAVLQGAISSVRSAVTTSVELEAAFRNVQAVTATTKTEMVGLEEKIKSVAATTKFSAVEVAGAALILGQAGMSAKQVGEAIPAIVALAAASGTSLAQAVDLATSVVGVFDKKASDTADIANKITQAANSSKVSVDKLALGLQYAGNIAAQSGVSFEETTAAMSAMSNAGIKSGSTMGTGLRQFMIEVQKPSVEFLKIVHQLGLSMADLDFKSKGFVGVIETLHQAGFVASDAIKSFDVRGAAAFNAMMADPEALRRQYEGLLETKAAMAANAVQMDSLKSQATRLTTAFGNLTSEGLGPLSTALKTTFGVFADLMEEFRKFPGVIKGVTTAIVALIAAGLYLHYKSLIVAAMGMIEVHGLLKVAFVEYRIALAIAADATVAAGAATLSLTGILNILKASLVSISAFVKTHWVGLIVAGVSAAYMLWANRSNEATDAIDKQKASVTNAKAALDEKADSVRSLTNKITELEYRESSLSKNKGELIAATKEVNNQFGSLGIQLDSNNPRFDTMIQKLRDVKNEMQKLEVLKAFTNLQENRTLLKQQSEDAQKALEKARTGFLPGVAKSETQTLADFSNAMLVPGRGLAPSQIQQGKAAMTVIQGSKDLMAVGQSLQVLLGILHKATGEDAPAIANLQRLEDKVFNNIVSKLGAVAGTTKDVANAEATVGGLEAQQNFRGMRLFPSASNRSGGMGTFEEVLPKLLPESLLVNQAQPGLNKLEVYERTRKIRLEKIAAIEAVIDRLEDPQAMAGVPSSVVNASKTEAKGVLESIRAAGKNEWDQEAKSLAEKLMLERVGVLKQKLASRSDRSVLGTGATKAAEQLEIGRLQSEFSSMGVYGRDEVSRAKADKELAVARAAADVTLGNADRAAGDRNINEKIASLKKQAESFDVIAKGEKLGADNSHSVEEIGAAMDRGMSDLFKSKAKRVEALLLEQNKRVNDGDTTRSTKEFKDAEMKALEAEEQEKITNYMLGFKSLTSAVTKRLEKSGTQMQRLSFDESLTELRYRNEEQLYASQEEARRLREGIASGDLNKAGQRIKTVGQQTLTAEGDVTIDAQGIKHRKTPKTIPGGVSSKILGAGSIELKIEELKNSKIKLAGLVAELEFIGDEEVGYIEFATRDYDKKKELRTSLLMKIANLEQSEGGAQGDDLLRIRSSLSLARGELKTAEDGEISALAELKKSRTARGTTRKAIDDLRVTIEAQEQAIPQEVTWENLSKKMKQVWGQYTQYVKDMDVLGVLGTGMTGVLQSLSGGFASFFSNIASGSMTAGQAFRQMAVSIIRSMMDVFAQALAMQAVRGILSLFMGAAASTVGVPAMAAPGGGTVMTGFPAPAGLPMAKGGPIRGGTPGKDSVGILAMPGEFMLKKQAVDAIGLDFLTGLNNTTNTTLAQSSGPANLGQSRPADTTNVWVVAPEAKPTMGPKDVVVAITDDMMRGGPTRQLVKQIQAGA